SCHPDPILLSTELSWRGQWKMALVPPVLRYEGTIDAAEERMVKLVFPSGDGTQLAQLVHYSSDMPGLKVKTDKIDPAVFRLGCGSPTLFGEMHLIVSMPQLM